MCVLAAYEFSRKFPGYTSSNLMERGIHEVSARRFVLISADHPSTHTSHSSSIFTHLAYTRSCFAFVIRSRFCGTLSLSAPLFERGSPPHLYFRDGVAPNVPLWIFPEMQLRTP